jgi:hypothetical protein
VGHLQANGFDVQVNHVSESQLYQVKAKHGVPAPLQSCHTALVGGYVIEGHVPADLIRRLLKEKPNVIGLAVPGMPIGSPGMEGPKAEPYDVFAIERNGRARIYARR